MVTPNYKLMRLNFAHIIFVGGIVDEFKMEQYAENNFLSMINKTWIGDFILTDIKIFKRADIKNVYDSTFYDNKIGVTSNLTDIRYRNSEISTHIMFKW